MKKYIDINNITYRVKNYNPDKCLNVGTAYIRGKYVFPYFGDINFIEDDILPGIYKEDGTYFFVLPISKKQRQLYLKENIYDVNNNDDILKLLENENITIDDDIIEGDNATVFAPTLKSEDNFLQALIKKALMQKQIDLNTRKNRFDSPSDMSNRKNALLYHGKMSAEKFMRWCDILDLKFKIVVENKSDKVPNPLKEALSFERK